MPKNYFSPAEDIVVADGSSQTSIQLAFVEPVAVADVQLVNSRSLRPPRSCRTPKSRQRTCSQKWQLSQRYNTKEIEKLVCIINYK